LITFFSATVLRVQLLKVFEIENLALFLKWISWLILLVIFRTLCHNFSIFSTLLSFHTIQTLSFCTFVRQRILLVFNIRYLNLKISNWSPKLCFLLFNIFLIILNNLSIILAISFLVIKVVFTSTTLGRFIHDFRIVWDSKLSELWRQDVCWVMSVYLCLQYGHFF